MARFECGLQKYLFRNNVAKLSNEFLEVYYDLKLFVKHNTHFYSLNLEFFDPIFNLLVKILIFIFTLFFIFKLITMIICLIRRLKNYIRENLFRKLLLHL